MLYTATVDEDEDETPTSEGLKKIKGSRLIHHFHRSPLRNNGLHHVAHQRYVLHEKGMYFFIIIKKYNICSI